MKKKLFYIANADGTYPLKEGYIFKINRTDERFSEYMYVTAYKYSKYSRSWRFSDYRCGCMIGEFNTLDAGKYYCRIYFDNIADARLKFKEQDEYIREQYQYHTHKDDNIGV